MFFRNYLLVTVAALLLTLLKGAEHSLANRFTLARLPQYHDEHTRSLPITEVKHRRARIVILWLTAYERLVS